MTEHGRCRTCRHWRQHPDRVAYRLPSNMRECSAVYLDRREEIGDRVAVALCTLDGGIEAELLTLDTFGCVLWEGE